MVASFQFSAPRSNSNTPIPPPCVMAMRFAQRCYANGEVNEAIEWVNGALTPLLSSSHWTEASRLLTLDGNVEFCNAVMSEVNKGDAVYQNLDLLVLKTFLSVLDQSKSMKVTVAGIFLLQF